MRSQLRALPILEQWDCHQCTVCCRNTTIRLDPDDLQRLKQQRWEEHPQYRGTRIVQRSLWLGGAPVLAHQTDGSCVFLTQSGRCRIHEVFGPEAKPYVCQLFPLQVLTTDRETSITVLRSCPSAAADRGRSLTHHLGFLKRLLRHDSSRRAAMAAPPIVARTVRSWDDFHRVTDSLQRLLVDDRFPLIRRVVHSLRFCSLLEQCKWKRLASNAIAELVDMLEQEACHDAGQLFQDRQPPSHRTARLFRRLGAHFIRCFPGSRPTLTLADHWHVLRLSGRMARATSVMPELHPRFPAISVDRLERPLGPLTSEVLHPLHRFYEAHAVSKRYILDQPARPVVDGVRRLAFAFPMSLWMLRWLVAEREPTAEDMVQIVVALERGIVMPALSRAASFFAESDQLERLIAWYGR